MSTPVRHISIDSRDYEKALGLLVVTDRKFYNFGPGAQIWDEVHIPVHKREVVHTVTAGRSVFIFPNPSSPEEDEFFIKGDDAYDYWAKKFAEVCIESRFFMVRYL